MTSNYFTKEEIAKLAREIFINTASQTLCADPNVCFAMAKRFIEYRNSVIYKAIDELEDEAAKKGAPLIAALAVDGKEQENANDLP